MNPNTIASQKSSQPAQVGGSHYHETAAHCPGCGCEIQHWDLYAKQPYLVGNITKYFTRFTAKDGLQDVKKGLSYVQKALDTYFPGQLRLTVERVEPATADPQQPSENGSGCVPSDVPSGVVANDTAKALYRALVIADDEGEKIRVEGPLGVAQVDLDEYAKEAQKQREVYEAGCLTAAECTTETFEDAAEKATVTPVSDEEAVAAARARADAYAQQKPDDDVPEGYTIERIQGAPGWHFRAVIGGNWSRDYAHRLEALTDLKAYRAGFIEFPK